MTAASSSTPTSSAGIRPIVLNRKNALFAGHDEGAENWACTNRHVYPPIIDAFRRTGAVPRELGGRPLRRRYRLVSLEPEPSDDLTFELVVGEGLFAELCAIQECHGLARAGHCAQHPFVLRRVAAGLLEPRADRFGQACRRE